MQKTFLLTLCALLINCASPLKGKSPYWYNGYVYGTQAYDLFAQGKPLNAIASYEKGLAEARRYDIPGQASLYEFNLGRCWYELDEFDSALAYFSTCNRDYLLLSDTLAACRSAGFAALCLCAEGNLDSAFVLYKQGSSWLAWKKTTRRFGSLSTAGCCGSAIMEKKRLIISKKLFPNIKNKKPSIPWPLCATIAPEYTISSAIIRKRKTSLTKPSRSVTNPASSPTVACFVRGRENIFLLERPHARFMALRTRRQLCAARARHACQR